MEAPRHSKKLIFNEGAFKSRTRQRLKEALMFGPMCEVEKRINVAIDEVHKEFYASITVAAALGAIGAMLGQYLWGLF